MIDTIGRLHTMTIADKLRALARRIEAREEACVEAAWTCGSSQESARLAGRCDGFVEARRMLEEFTEGLQ